MLSIRYPIHRSRVRLAKDGENNLKLDTEAGAIPEQIFIKSKRDSEGDEVVLPTINLTSNPFNVPDEHLPDIHEQEPGETEKGETPSPMQLPTLKDSTEPMVETVNDDEPKDNPELGQKPS